MKFKVVVEPDEPIALADVKAHLRIEHSTDDAYIQSLITEARQECEHLCGRYFGAQTVVGAADGFSDAMLLPSGTAVTWVRYTDRDGAEQTLSNTVYGVDDTSAMGVVVYLRTGQKWPEIADVPSPVRVQFEAGSDVIPGPVRRWIMLVVGRSYEIREATTTDGGSTDFAFVDRLLDGYRIQAV